MLASSACATPQPPAEDTGPRARPPAEAPTPPRIPVGPTAEMPPRAAERVRLVEVSRRKLARGEMPRELAGGNKANGFDYRLRRDVGDVPPAIPRTEEGLELFITDTVPEGWLTLYRTPLHQGNGMHGNGRFRAVLFSRDGRTRRWSLELNRFFSATEHLEVQDVRYVRGKLYFNEACQTYSREAGGKCSALVRVDPVRGAVDWRTPPLTSNNVFIVHGAYVLAGYGFTAEPDYVHVIDAETGRILARTRVDSAPTYVEARGSRVWVVTYGDTLYGFDLVEE
ncbi:MAG TPA: hypothetical protein VHG91_21710 [Longimicrobium sp.]|nr:hypothetical protein [Longimicrobium sp.]